MMKIKTIALAVMMGTSLMASNLSRPQAEAPKEVRNHFIDFNTANPNAEVSYTISIQISAIRPRLDTTLGFESFAATEEEPFIEGSSLGFMQEVLPAIGGEIIFSDQNSATLFKIGIDHYNKFGVDAPMNVQENSQFFLNQSFHGAKDPISYTQIHGTFNNQKTSIKAGIGGYSLQYRNFSLSSLFGIVGSHMALETAVEAVKVDTDELIAHTFGGTQTSLASGLYCSFKPSLVLFDSQFSAIYFSAEVGITGEYSANNGSVYAFELNRESGVKSNTSNIAIEPYSLSSSIDKKLSLSLVSKPQENDMSFFTLQLGAGQNRDTGKNVISKAQKGSATDITTSFVYLSLAYTM